MNRVLVLLGVIFTIALSATPAAAQTQPVVPDRIDLVGLTSKQPRPDSPSNEVQFEAVVNYRLQSSQTGFVLLFLFENSAADSSQESTNSIPVQQGSGQLVLTIDYTLRPEVKNLTLVAGLFRGEQRLLAWVSTNPIDMGPWPGRVAFEKAMALRLGNDYAAADQQLTTAIQEAPTTGNYFYWRGDTRVRLNRFEDAIGDFTRSLELMPQDRASRVGRGIARLWTGSTDAAIDDLGIVIETSTTPDRVTAWAYRARGVANASLGHLPEAVSDYQAYLALSPEAADRAEVEGWITDLM
jgi:tetratricopeptide (TPR) repeat protein